MVQRNKIPSDDEIRLLTQRVVDFLNQSEEEAVRDFASPDVRNAASIKILRDLVNSGVAGLNIFKETARDDIRGDAVLMAQVEMRNIAQRLFETIPDSPQFISAVGQLLGQVSLARNDATNDDYFVHQIKEDWLLNLYDAMLTNVRPDDAYECLLFEGASHTLRNTRIGQIFENRIRAHISSLEPTKRDSAEEVQFRKWIQLAVAMGRQGDKVASEDWRDEFAIPGLRTAYTAFSAVEPYHALAVVDSNLKSLTQGSNGFGDLYFYGIPNRERRERVKACASGAKAWVTGRRSSIIGDDVVFATLYELRHLNDRSVRERLDKEIAQGRELQSGWKL